MTINRLDQLKNIQEKALELFKNKYCNYEGTFDRYGTLGMMVRINDKLKLFVNTDRTSVSLVNNEALRDTLIDLQIYAAMAVLLLDENKCEKKEETYLIEPNMPIY